VAALRQIDKCAIQCDTYSGITGTGFFAGLAESVNADGRRGTAITEALTSGAAAADAAYATLGSFLRSELRQHAPEKDAVGRERYELASRDFLGAVIDLEETYAWGWSEFLAIEAEMREVAERVAPGTGPAGAAAALDADPEYQITGLDALQSWMQDLSDRAVADLGARYFEINDQIRTLECLIAPPGGGVGAYYTGPSDDFSRPGRMWWAVEPGREVFSTWRETSTVYHEGVPGHHLQIATAVAARTPSTTSSGCSPGPRRTPKAGRCTRSGWSANWGTCAATASCSVCSTRSCSARPGWSSTSACTSSC
jgi:uncharacterized protein (DUF885 family)